MITLKSTNIEKNRARFLKVLRSGKYTKGIATSDKKGKPIVKVDGYCACAVMVHEFGGTDVGAYTIARKRLGLTGKDCTFIQILNDTKLTFPQIADRIEKEVFI